MPEEKEETPDWLADVLKEAQERAEEAPAMTPPPVNRKENIHFLLSEEDRAKRDKLIDSLIIVFIISCFIGALYVMIFI
jgi:hypothetical protein